MNNEDKQLLLKDLCARLPYKVKVQYLDLEDNRLDSDIAMGVTLDGYKGMPTVDVFQYGFLIEKVKPFLRPWSSMTASERDELLPLFDMLDENYNPHEEMCYRAIDWLNEHHIDYRGLLEKRARHRSTRWYV